MMLTSVKKDPLSKLKKHNTTFTVNFTVNHAVVSFSVTVRVVKPCHSLSE